jgi:hypothetical protein
MSVKHHFDYETLPRSVKHLKIQLSFSFGRKMTRKGLLDTPREPVRIDCLDLEVKEYSEMHYIFSQIIPVKLAILNVTKDFRVKKGEDLLSLLNQLTVDVLLYITHSCKKSFIDGFMNLEGPKHKYLKTYNIT